MRYEQAQSSRKVPHIVELCVDFLRNNGLEVEGLFRLYFLHVRLLSQGECVWQFMVLVYSTV